MRTREAGAAAAAGTPEPLPAEVGTGARGQVVPETKRGLSPPSLAEKGRKVEWKAELQSACVDLVRGLRWEHFSPQMLVFFPFLPLKTTSPIGERTSFENFGV